SVHRQSRQPDGNKTVVRGYPETGKGTKVRGSCSGIAGASQAVAKSFSRVTHASIVSPHESEFFPVSSRNRRRAFAELPRFGRERAGHSKETSCHGIPWNNRGRPISVARSRRRLPGQSVV